MRQVQQKLEVIIFKIPLVLLWLVFTVAGSVVFDFSAATHASDWANEPDWLATPGSPPSTGRGSKNSHAIPGPFAPGTSNVGLNVGQVFLVDSTEDYTDNIGFELGYTYGVSDMFGFESSIGYSSHSDGDYNMTNMLFGLRTNLAWFDRIIPFANVGMGFYRPSYTFRKSGEDGPRTANLSTLVFGIHVGAGLDLQITNRLFFGTTLSLHNIFGTKKAHPFKGEEDIEISGVYIPLLIRAGVTF